MTKTISLWAASVGLLVGVALLGAYIGLPTAFAASSLFGGATASGGEVTLVSNTGDSDPNNDYSGISFDDMNGQPFSALTTLGADYNVTDDDCGAGSPRFQVRLDENDNGIDDAGDGNIFVYFGPSPSFTDCASGWQSTGNLIGNNDAGRWSSEQITGGVNSGTYAQALAAASTLDILDINIVVDSGWNSGAANGDSEQTNLIDNVAINNAVHGFGVEPVTVTIHKYVDGEHADSTSAEGQSFPMQSSWSNAGFPDGNNASYSLSPSNYEAETAEMNAGANYSTNEVTNTAVVGPNCEDGQLFKLVGYSWGDTVEAAEAMSATTTSPAFTDLQNDKQVIVWNEDCTPDFVDVTIIKYIDGEHATAENANAAIFPFTATYNASNIGAGSDPFSIGPVGNNTPEAYEAQTIDLASGADYKAEENTSGNDVVGATCEEGKPFALQGYSSGSTLQGAQNASTSPSAPAFTELTSDQFVIVKNVTCEPEADDVTVTIVKYIDSTHATSGNADDTSFPMESSWDDANNGGVGNGVYALGTTGYNTPNPYEAVTTDMANGSDYTTNEDLTTSVVGPNCDNGQDYRLLGYTTGDTLQEAQGDTPDLTIPAFTDLSGDKYVIVWNEPCEDEEPPTNGAACEMPTSAPAGYTLQNGTPGNDKVTLAPNTMFVGNGGNDKVTGSDGNYIVCTENGNDTITLGNGDSEIDAGGGNNKISVGNGSGNITTEGGNDKIVVGTGDHAIDAGGGNNTISTGDGTQTITAENGNDKVTTGGGNDTINVGGGNNTVYSGGGDDSVTAENGNDKIDGGAGSNDACNAGGGNNVVVNCEL